jgi:hypothetical protein
VTLALDFLWPGGFQSISSCIFPNSVEVAVSLRSKLRNAEQYGAKAAHLSAERIRAGVHDLEASLHKLGSHGRAKSDLPVSAHPDPELQSGASSNSKVRTGIVSVNGRDVGEMRCTGGRGPA